MVLKVDCRLFLAQFSIHKLAYYFIKTCYRSLAKDLFFELIFGIQVIESFFLARITQINVEIFIQLMYSVNFSNTC